MGSLKRAAATWARKMSMSRPLSVEMFPTLPAHPEWSRSVRPSWLTTAGQCLVRSARLFQEHSVILSPSKSVMLSTLMYAERFLRLLVCLTLSSFATLFIRTAAGMCQGNSVSKQVCRNVPKQECKDVPEVVEKLVPVQVCNTMPRQVCRDETKQVCLDQPKEICNEEPVEVCDIYDQKSSRQTCKNVTKTNCHPVSEEVCHYI